MDTVIETLIGALSGAGIFLALLLLLGDKIFDKLLERTQTRFEKSLDRLNAYYDTQLDFGSKVDTSLRDLRIASYKSLWSVMLKVPQWPRNKITYRDLLELSECLKKWYFTEGGVFLSKTSRESFFALQETLGAILTMQDTENLKQEQQAREEFFTATVELDEISELAYLNQQKKQLTGVSNEDQRLLDERHREALENKKTAQNYYDRIKKGISYQGYDNEDAQKTILAKGNQDIDNNTYQFIRKQFSLLRTALTADILSRSAAPKRA